MNARRLKAPERTGRTWLRGALLALIAILAGCAARQSAAEPPAASIQVVQYYPYQVKGYEGTFQRRRIVVLPAVEARPADESGPPHDGYLAIGVVENQDSQIVERLYGPPSGELVQQSIAQAAKESGLDASSSASSLTTALEARTADYIAVPRVLHLWVIKRRRPDTPEGESWASAAIVSLEVSIYKPPFSIAFWQGVVAASYTDPPPARSGGVVDQTEIYDQPGDVLSVALTRAAAGVFNRDDLRTLVQQDSLHAR